MKLPALLTIATILLSGCAGYDPVTVPRPAYNSSWITHDGQPLRWPACPPYNLRCL